jgi:hypothetical protein
MSVAPASQRPARSQASIFPASRLPPRDTAKASAPTDAPRRLALVVEVGEAGEPGEAPADVTMALSFHV